MNRRITRTEFIRLAEYIKKNCGIVLDLSKTYLVEGRLGPLLDKMGCEDYNALVLKAGSDSSGKIGRQIIDCITTNETFFFRDNHPFVLLKHKIIPDIFERNPKNPPQSIKILSAACSSGQEVYSIAIVAKEAFPKLKIYILGTDISESILKIASAGRYTKFELSRGLTAKHLQKYFIKEDEVYRIRAELRGSVQFRLTNLLKPKAITGMFHIIFCRNVAIYFSSENRRLLFDRLADHLYPKGTLMIGATESLIHITDRFKRCQSDGRIYYEKIY